MPSDFSIGAFSLDDLRSLFPAFERVVWVNTPAAPPGARPVLAALRAAERQWELGDFDWQEWEQHAEATRGLFARLIGGSPADVALLGSLSEAAATVARSLPVGKIVVPAYEFQSNLFPWLALEALGSKVHVIDERAGAVDTDRICEAIDDETVLVAISAVQSMNGYRVDLGDVAARCRETGTRLFVNVTQSLGVLPFSLDVVNADYVACHGYKWLLCPRGAAWLYVRHDRVAEARPLAPNWKSIPDPYSEYYGGPLEVAAGARKLDASLAWFSWIGARAALDLVLSLDRAEVETRCLGLARSFREGARSAGFRLAPEGEPSQIVAVRVPDPDALRRRLHQRRVIASVRGDFVRLGFHAFNDETDATRALHALGAP